jgi:hypothetical protein
MFCSIWTHSEKIWLRAKLRAFLLRNIVDDHTLKRIVFPSNKISSDLYQFMDMCDIDHASAPGLSEDIRINTAIEGISRTHKKTEKTENTSFDPSFKIDLLQFDF